MKINTPHKRWIARVAALTLLGGAGILAAAHITMPTVEAQVSGAKSAPVPPALVGKSWLNTPGGKPISLADRRGEVTIVQFWTFGCSNCLANLPAYEHLQKQFAGRGVEIIGVHTPETDHERDPANVARRVKALHITHPVLLDASGENWNRWRQQFWPTFYVLDRAGRVRFKWEGELNYNGAGGEKKAAALIENLLREPKPASLRAQSPAAFQLVSDEKPAAKGVGRVVKTEAQWKKILTPAQFSVLRQEGTEAPFSGDFHPKKQAGTWNCAACNLELFRSNTQFDSGTGWPSFWQPISGHVTQSTDADGERAEIKCARCGGHLGHVFDDGPKPTGLRYCMNSVAMKFQPAKK